MCLVVQESWGVTVLGLTLRVLAVRYSRATGVILYRGARERPQSAAFCKSRLAAGRKLVSRARIQFRDSDPISHQATGGFRVVRKKNKKPFKLDTDYREDNGIIYCSFGIEARGAKWKLSKQDALFLWGACLLMQFTTRIQEGEETRGNKKKKK